MNKKYFPLIAFLTLTLLFTSISIALCTPKAKTYNAKVVYTDTTRNYKYEHYCDSIYNVNPDYYLDVLVETDEYQDYIEKHGQWWKK